MQNWLFNFFQFSFQSSKFQIYSIKTFSLTFVKIFWKKKIRKYFSIINWIFLIKKIWRNIYKIEKLTTTQKLKWNFEKT